VQIGPDLFLQGLIVEGGPGSIGGGGEHPRIENPRVARRPGVMQQFIMLPGPNAGFPPPSAVSVVWIWVVGWGLVAKLPANVVLQRPWLLVDPVLRQDLLVAHVV